MTTGPYAEAGVDQWRHHTEGASAIAAEINGFAGSHVGELVGTPPTAHFLGGCPIGSSRETAVPAEVFGALWLPFLGMPKVPSK